MRECASKLRRWSDRGAPKLFAEISPLQHCLLPSVRPFAFLVPSLLSAVSRFANLGDALGDETLCDVLSLPSPPSLSETYHL